MPKRFRAAFPVALAMLGVAAIVTPALAADEDCPDHPRSEWMGQNAITTKAKEQGYDVRGVKADDGCWQVKGYDKDGKRVQLYYDPVSGEILKVQN